MSITKSIKVKKQPFNPILICRYKQCNKSNSFFIIILYYIKLISRESYFPVNLWMRHDFYCKEAHPSPQFKSHHGKLLLLRKPRAESQGNRSRGYHGKCFQKAKGETAKQKSGLRNISKAQKCFLGTMRCSHRLEKPTKQPRYANNQRQIWFKERQDVVHMATEPHIMGPPRSG